MKSILLLGFLTLIFNCAIVRADSLKVFDLSSFRRGMAVFDINLSRDQRRVFIPTNQVMIIDRDLARVVKTLDVPSPHAVLEDSKGSIYVATHRNGRILKFDRQYQEVKDWDRMLVASGEIKAPVAIELGMDDSLYICDWIKQRVIHVNSRGELISVFEDKAIKATAEFQAHGLSVDAKRKRVYVADRGNYGGNGAIHVFALNGQYLLTWPKPAVDFDPFTIRALTEDLYISPSYADGAFYIFDSNGVLLEKIDAMGSEPGKFNHASGVVADRRGFIYVPELKGDRIQRLDFNEVIKRNGQKIGEP